MLYQIFTGNVRFLLTSCMISLTFDAQTQYSKEKPARKHLSLSSFNVCVTHRPTTTPRFLPVVGFGIRNFLTLFLSIEASKAMDNASDALKRGDVVDAKFEEKRIELFTHQMDTSNPVLMQSVMP